MSELLFYDKPVALNKDLHSKSKYVPVEDYSFASGANSVFLTGGEFGLAAKEYPIVFSQAVNGAMVPGALLGLRNSENLFIDSKKKWVARYIPAFVRRYPFVLAEGGSEEGKLTVCIDASYKGFGGKKGNTLFTAEGQANEELQKIMKFLQEYRGQFQLTERFAEKLKSLDLLTEYSANIELKDGDKFVLGGLFIVNEKKMLELGEKEVMGLFKSGQLAWIYFHLSSLSNMGRLVDMAVEKG